MIANESPLKQYFDTFDIQHMDWTDEQYIQNALQEPIEKMTNLLMQDWKWRAEHKQNIVASIEGKQGQGKSKPFTYASLLAGSIFGVPFTADNIYFSIEELNEAISHAKPRETFLKDETRQTRAGMMSLMQEQNLADYEEQLRIHQNNLFYCSVALENHAHFFVFEAKHIIWNDAGDYPIAFLSVLKTARYTKPNQLAWRGLIKFPMPNPKICEEYDLKKENHITNLLDNKFSTLTPVRLTAERIFVKRLDDLTRITENGFILPKQSEMMTFIIDEEIGTSKFTLKGYSLLEALIRKRIEEKYLDYNDELRKKLDTGQSAKLDFRRQKAESEKEKYFMKQDLIKKKLELKERELDLREKNLNTRVPNNNAE